MTSIYPPATCHSQQDCNLHGDGHDFSGAAEKINVDFKYTKENVFSFDWVFVIEFSK